MISARCELRLAGVHPDLVRVVRRAAEGGAIIWGGAWGRTVHEWPKGGAEAAKDAYVAERRSAGRRPFLDGPHFELPAAVYPV
jgi:peptidoglycan L-alanyl-D-glutamate endopeptidase CwlK